MKKEIAVLLSFMLIFALAAGCQSTGSSTMKYKPGAYTGTGIGMMGEVAVNVRFSESRILDISVGQHNETYGIGWGVDNSPVDTLPKAIVENQSLAVDRVTGATMTSNAIRNAVADAVTKAGGDAAALQAKAVTKPAPKDAEYQCDVVVAGAGAAGMNAAIKAASAGAKVILVEKNGFAGGTTTLCGSKLMATETKYRPNETTDALFDYMVKISEGNFNGEKVRAFLEASGGILDWYESLGSTFIAVEQIFEATAPYRVVYNTGPIEKGHILEDRPYKEELYGGYYTVPLLREAKRLGVTILYNTPAKEILMEGGKAAGLRCEGPGGSNIIVRAKSTVLATGGYAGNRELIKESAQLANVDFTNALVSRNNMGDGIMMARAVGAKTIVSPTAMGMMMAPYLAQYYYGLVIDKDGKRFTNEYAYFFRVTADLAKTGMYKAHFIVDESYYDPAVQTAIASGTLISANSVEELAQKIGVTPAQLQATIDRYNALSAKGVDDDFGKDPSMMKPIDQSKKLYAFKLTFAINDTYGGIITDINSQVLDNNNSVIAGLYAAGVVAFGDLINVEYPGCGFAVGTSTYFGQVAGINAAAFAKK